MANMASIAGRRPTQFGAIVGSRGGFAARGSIGGGGTVDEARAGMQHERYTQPSSDPVHVLQPHWWPRMPVGDYYLLQQVEKEPGRQLAQAQHNGCYDIHCCCCCCCCCFRRKTCYCDGDGVVFVLETVRKHVRLFMPNKYNTPRMGMKSWRIF